MGIPFDVEALNQLRSELLERRSRIDHEMTRRELEQGELENIDTQAEMVDLAQNLELIERNVSLQEQERRELASIDLALAKLGSGTYGACEDCGEAIPVRRLQIVPEARLCARCQSVSERERSRSRVAS
jgi:DnaK suppressor protein